MNALVLFWFACSTSTPPEAAAEVVEEAAPAPIECLEGEVVSGEEGGGEAFWCEQRGIRIGAYAVFSGKTRLVSGKYKTGKKVGTWVWRYENNKKKESGRFADGKQAGNWVTFYESGEKHEDGDYLRGRRQGTWTVFAEDGKKAMEGMYIQGLKSGEWKVFSPEDTNHVEKLVVYHNDEIKSETLVDPPPEEKKEGE